MKAVFLTFSLLLGDITPEIDDKFESENSSQASAPTAADQLPQKITPVEAKRRKPHSAVDVAKLQKLDGQTISVQGKVDSVYIPKSGSPVILNMGPDFKSCFKAVIYDRKFRDWNLSAAEIGKLYEGREVVVEGQVSLFKELPQVEIQSPAGVLVVE